MLTTVRYLNVNLKLDLELFLDLHLDLRLNVDARFARAILARDANRLKVSA